MTLIPEARIDDGYLHLLAVNVGYFRVAYNLLKSLVAPIRTGEYRKATNVVITLKEPRFLQIDGNIYKKASQFHFTVLPGALKLIF
jgi:diacylglycerol kinase family enzyme